MNESQADLPMPTCGVCWIVWKIRIYPQHIIKQKNNYIDYTQLIERLQHTYVREVSK